MCEVSLLNLLMFQLSLRELGMFNATISWLMVYLFIWSIKYEHVLTLQVVGALVNHLQVLETFIDTNQILLS